VAAAEEQDRRTAHAEHGHQCRADVGGFRVIDPLNPVELANNFESVGERVKGTEGARHGRSRVFAPMRIVGHCNGQRRGERVGDIVSAQQIELGARYQPLAENAEGGFIVEPGIGTAHRRKPELRAINTFCHIDHSPVVGIAHPARVRRCIRKEPRLVGVILVGAWIAVEVVGRQVGEHADGWLQPRRVVQLERRHLERDPFRLRIAHCDFRQRCPDVTGIHRAGADST